MSARRPIGRYRVIRLLGSGGMGEVFEVLDFGLAKWTGARAAEDDRITTDGLVVGTSITASAASYRLAICRRAMIVRAARSGAAAAVCFGRLGPLP